LDRLGGRPASPRYMKSEQGHLGRVKVGHLPAPVAGWAWWAPTIWSSTSVANLTLLEPVSALEDCTPVEGAFLAGWAPGPLS
jgi:hypothetical protein